MLPAAVCRRQHSHLEYWQRVAAERQQQLAKGRREMVHAHADNVAAYKRERHRLSEVRMLLEAASILLCTRGLQHSLTLYLQLICSLSAS
jgi:hypothetical protein